MPSKEARTTGTITRREFIRDVTNGAIMLTILGAADVACPLALDAIHLIFINDEGSTSASFKGKELTGGEIISEAELIKRYKETIISKKPVEFDPTIIKSTLYHAMRLYGQDDETAKRRANHVYISYNTEITDQCSGYACVSNKKSGIGVEISEENLKIKYPNPEDLWYHLIHLLGHEAYHMTAEKVSIITSKENYGFLGEITKRGSQFGFISDILEAEDSELDLINIPLVNPDNNTEISYIIPEEFLADSASRRFYKKLYDAGLKGAPFADDYLYGVGYPLFSQGLVNIEDTVGIGGKSSWQSYWQNQLNSTSTDLLHFRGERKKFYENLGRVFFAKNRYYATNNFNSDDIAGIGVIAFADFAVFGATKYEYLKLLASSNDLSYDRLKILAKDLRRKIQAQTLVPKSKLFTTVIAKTTATPTPIMIDLSPFAQKTPVAIYDSVAI